MVDNIKHEGPSDFYADHLIVPGPFKDHNKKLHTKVQSYMCNHLKQDDCYIFTLNKPYYTCEPQDGITFGPGP